MRMLLRLFIQYLRQMWSGSIQPPVMDSVQTVQICLWYPIY